MNATPHPLVGALFADDYRVESLLAEGGMGAVFAVVQQSTGRRRALKLLRPALASDPSTRERFIREARVGSSIESDHVVEVIDAGFDPATSAPFLVMELLDGSDLHRYVTARGALEVREAREVLRQLCHALAAAHAAGVIHRDLKPENVFVARSRRADVPFTIKLLDFGIASVLEQSATSHATGAIVGSPAWMAPEQVDTGLIRASTDVWALGLIAFWALTGKHYWKCANHAGSTLQALLVEKLVEPLDRASQRAQQVGSTAALTTSFDEWFARCVCRDPAGRFHDAAAAWSALDRALSESSPSLSLSGTVVAGPQSAPSWPQVAHSSTPSQPIARTVIAAPTGPVPAAPRRAARRTAALALAVVTLVAGAASGAWILAAKGAPRAQGAGVVAVAPAVAAAPVVAHTHSSGQQIFSEDVVESLADAARSAEPSAPVVLARRPPRATTVEQRFARTLPRAVDAGVAAAPVAQSAPQVVVGAVASSGGPPTGGRPSRCSSYMVIERRASAMLAHAASVEATDPVMARNERTQAMVMRAGVDTQVAQLRTMARGELASDPEFVAMAREVDQCVANLRRANP
jgi:serine/threonine protein kinase